MNICLGPRIHHKQYLTPEDPQRAGDNDESRDDDADDELACDDRIFRTARRLLNDVVVDRLYAQAGASKKCTDGNQFKLFKISARICTILKSIKFV